MGVRAGEALKEMHGNSTSPSMRGKRVGARRGGTERPLPQTVANQCFMAITKGGRGTRRGWGGMGAPT
jgi:hypothetical protein